MRQGGSARVLGVLRAIGAFFAGGSAKFNFARSGGAPVDREPAPTPAPTPAPMSLPPPGSCVPPLRPIPPPPPRPDKSREPAPTPAPPPACSHRYVLCGSHLGVSIDIYKERDPTSGLTVFRPYTVYEALRGLPCPLCGERVTHVPRSLDETGSAKFHFAPDAPLPAPDSPDHPASGHLS